MRREPCLIVTCLALLAVATSLATAAPAAASFSVEAPAAVDLLDGRASFSVTVSNEGVRPIVVNLSARGGGGGAVAFDPPSVEVMPGGRATSWVAVREGPEGGGLLTLLAQDLKLGDAELDRVERRVALRPAATGPLVAPSPLGSPEEATREGAAVPPSGLHPAQTPRLDRRVMAAGALAAAGATVALAARFLRRAPVLALFARIPRSRVADHPTRAALLAAIHAEPGIATRALQRRLGLSNGRFLHHLATLKRAGAVVSRRDGQASRLFAAGAPAPVGLPPTGERILASVRAAQRGLNASSLAAALGLARQTVHYHLRALASEGLVQVERRGRQLYVSAK